MSKTVEIKNEKPRLYTANGITLQPGLNRLSEEDAKKFLSHPHMQIKVERGIIALGKNAVLPELKGEAKKVAAASKPTTGGDENNGGKEPTKFDDLEYNIDGKNAHDSMDAIDTIEDVEYLKHIAETEERKTVKNAAEKRLEALAAADENGGDENNGGE